MTLKFAISTAWAVPRWCAHCAHGDARELQGGRGKNISEEESKISWLRINFSAEERAAEERGQAADCIILIEVHVIAIWSWVLARIPWPRSIDWLQIDHQPQPPYRPSPPATDHVRTERAARLCQACERRVSRVRGSVYIPTGDRLPPHLEGSVLEVRV